MSEEAQKIDPVALEQAMVAQEQKRTQEADPQEVASMMLSLYIPRFNALVDKLSSRQLRRLTKSLMEYPVGKTYTHTDPLEKEAAAIGNGLMDAKLLLITHTYHENRDRIMKEVEATPIETVFNEEEGKQDG